MVSARGYRDPYPCVRLPLADFLKVVINMSPTESLVSAGSDQTTVSSSELKPHPDFFFSNLYVAVRTLDLLSS